MMDRNLGRACLAAVVTLMLAGRAIVIAEQPHKHDHTSVLTTKKMCCSKESGPAIAEISKIPGVGKVVPDHKTRSLTIIPKDNAFPSPKAIWEAAEKVKIEPTRLATAHGVYNAKPRR
jgi:hypothetical protein